ncbi:hypothetical protein KUCAC02_037080 [Chaenocephalus aceratus]|nr:hypothetical protein KUCAC02_037080 [Chaenocephalus aceratus]
MQPSVSPGFQRRHTLPASEVRPLNAQDAISVFEIEREGEWICAGCGEAETRCEGKGSRERVSEKPSGAPTYPSPLCIYISQLFC